MTEPIHHRPNQIDPSTFVADGAVVVGDVTIEQHSSVWFHAVLRGDVAPIHVGSRTNIQDGAVLHADEGYPCVLGDGVTVGHNAIVHGCQIADDVLIGMGSVVMTGAVIGTRSIIGVGAVVTEGTEIPAGSLVLGIPAKVKRPVGVKDLESIHSAAEHYVENAKRYRGSD